MGALADSALAAGGTVIGVIPTRLVEHEIAHAGLTKLHVVETMHERKAMMAELADAVIALPGGTGTLDELFELFTWKQLGLHRKPIGLLDVDGYWQPLLGVLAARGQRAVPARRASRRRCWSSGAPRRCSIAWPSHRPAGARQVARPVQQVDRDRPERADQAVPNTRSPASPNPGRM